MKMWQLNPKDTKHHDWRASDWRDHAVIRARSADEAYKVAAVAFLVRDGSSWGNPEPVNPWRPDLVDIVEIKPESGPLLAGPPAVITPFDYDQEVAGIDFGSVWFVRVVGTVSLRKDGLLMPAPRGQYLMIGRDVDTYELSGYGLPTFQLTLQEAATYMQSNALVPLDGRWP